MELDIHDVQKVFGISVEVVKYSRQYHESRIKAANYKHSLDILLANAMPELSKGKRTLGAETALIMFLGKDDKEVNNIYKEYLYHKANADGLEKIIDALQGQVSLFQTISKTLPK